jgi:hypothetical protein
MTESLPVAHLELTPFELGIITALVWKTMDDNKGTLYAENIKNKLQKKLLDAAQVFYKDL